MLTLIVSQSQSQSHIATDGQSASQYVLVSRPNLGHLTRVFLEVSVCCVGFINPVGAVVGVWRQRLALSTGSN
jgi:hypothetical protein